MSNSSLVSYTRLTKNKSTRQHKIDSIIIHCIVGQWTAKQGCDYFATTDRECSANYVVGKDGDIGLSVEEAYRAWTSGGTLSANGITGAQFDHRAVTIEVASDTSHPYAVTDKAYNAVIELCADICKRNGIKKLLWKGDKKYVGTSEQNMGAHRWFANKSCPGDYLYERMGDIANKVNEKLSAKEESKEEPKEPETKTLYRVQVGAYKNKSNADAQLKKVKSAGFDTYMVKVDGLYKIQVGAYAVKSNAEKVLSQVKQKGFDAFITTKSGEPASVDSTNNTIIKVGDKVRVNKGAKSYTGVTLASFVFSTVYDVIQVDGDRVVIGLGKAVTAAMNKKDLKKV